MVKLSAVLVVLLVGLVCFSFVDGIVAQRQYSFGMGASLDKFGWFY
jgi:hypothetical protein